MEMLSVPIIAVLVFSVVEMIKLPFKNKPAFNNFIPMISGVLGAALGLVAYYVVPTLIPTANVFHAVIVGIASGLSATGSHQLVKQIVEKANKKANSADTSDQENGNIENTNGPKSNS